MLQQIKANGEEIELHIDSVYHCTLYQLYHVCGHLLFPINPKKPKATAAPNGKPKASRKTASGATSDSMPIPMSSCMTLIWQDSGGPHA
jgi:hypothetical protein